MNLNDACASKGIRFTRVDPAGFTRHGSPIWAFTLTRGPVSYEDTLITAAGHDITVGDVVASLWIRWANRDSSCATVPGYAAYIGRPMSTREEQADAEAAFREMQRDAAAFEALTGRDIEEISRLSSDFL